MTEQDMIIQDLRRENENLRAELEWKQKEIELARRHARQWISVEDRLPENDQKVLCFNYNGEYKVLRWNYIDWMWNSGIEWHKEDYVLYWMPLPQPPKGE